MSQEKTQNNTTTKHSEVTMNSGSVKWLVKELNQKIDFIPMNKWDEIKEVIKQAKEMEVAGREMSYDEGYKEGYKRALELIEWGIQQAKNK